MKKIIKIPADGLHVLELANEAGFVDNARLKFKIKRGKRWVLKSFRTTISNHHCECCGNFVRVSLSNSATFLDFNDHTGNPMISSNWLCCKER